MTRALPRTVVVLILASALAPQTSHASISSVLGAMHPRPEGVPRHAKASYSFKDGRSWRWVRTFERGCADWLATEGYARVQLRIDSRCDGGWQYPAGLAGRGLTHLSFVDHLTFQGFWPWSADDYYKLISFNEKGMISRAAPCPHTLSEDQIKALRTVAAEAYDKAQTDGERRVLTRVQQRLATLSGVRLASSQEGCTDSNAARDLPRFGYDSWKSP